ncbi:hypothetical protein Thimo_1410 [Thioflavicoccus mobilis 8321]|uniref:Lipoprotein n=1 Tax=Thioflavicoccus mobilis 8321 TaxID=765912 RepID=L0GY22_9GAMM|nr:hypothetical protein [Thioflavicoccus mobilis]AGA90204.1 hypothetical protein Thimo_1410 [Thioflavicoccus mobilis 8321]
MRSKPHHQRANLDIPRFLVVAALLVATPVLMGGCASGALQESSGVGLSTSTTPRWHVIEQGATGRGGVVDVTQGPPDGEASTVEGFVAARCRSAPAGSEAERLRALVADLYAAGVDPAIATEALITNRCDVLASVVREMVSQGGPEVVDPVADRALALSGPEMEPVIAAAALVGLEEPAGEADPSQWHQTYGMAYFSTRAGEAPLDIAGEAGALYREAMPGYGIYTFLLQGDPGALPGGDRSRYEELLRVIDSYVLAPDDPTDVASFSSHAFLVAVEPRRTDARVGVDPGTPASDELAAAMRSDFAAYLGAGDHQALARALRGDAGPFLVSSLEPRLVPVGGDGPRLLVDLSDVGVEYLYAVVDAYDRPIAEGPQDTAEGFAAIARRLKAVFPSRTGRGLVAAPHDWVTLLESGTTSNQAGARGLTKESAATEVAAPPPVPWPAGAVVSS